MSYSNGIGPPGRYDGDSEGYDNPVAQNLLIFELIWKATKTVRGIRRRKQDEGIRSNVGGHRIGIGHASCVPC